MKYTTQTLAAMSLKELAAIVNKPSLMKYSKAKAVDYVLKHLPTPSPTKKSKSATAPQADKAPRANKHDDLLEALRDGGTREQLMETSGFDNKNLSVAMCNLKNKGYVINVEIQAIGDDVTQTNVRFYSLVE